MDEMFVATLSLELDRLEEEAKTIAGLWDGDDPGAKEENAHIANDIIETSTKLRELLAEVITT